MTAAERSKLVLRKSWIRRTGSWRSGFYFLRGSVRVILAVGPWSIYIPRRIAPECVGIR